MTTAPINVDDNNDEGIFFRGGSVPLPQGEVRLNVCETRFVYNYNIFWGGMVLKTFIYGPAKPV